MGSDTDDDVGDAEKNWTLIVAMSLGILAAWLTCLLTSTHCFRQGWSFHDQYRAYFENQNNNNDPATIASRSTRARLDRRAAAQAAARRELSPDRRFVRRRQDKLRHDFVRKHVPHRIYYNVMKGEKVEDNNNDRVDQRPNSALRFAEKDATLMKDESSSDNSVAEEAVYV